MADNDKEAIKQAQIELAKQRLEEMKKKYPQSQIDKLAMTILDDDVYEVARAKSEKAAKEGKKEEVTNSDPKRGLN
jgi:hypothetical protein